MKRLIIHTGMHKSGSTALQAWLRDNACGGKYYCYRYNGSNTNLGLPLAVLFGDAPETHYYFRRNQNVCALEQLKSVFASVFLDQACCASPVHILSSEDLSNFSSGEHLKLRDFFCSHYDSINVVHVVRDPFSYLDSAFQEKVKTGYSDLCMSAILPDYKNRVEILADVYGASSLLVKPYSKEVIPGMILSPLLDGEWCRKAHENAHPFVGQNVSLECSTAGNNRSMTSTQLRLLYGFNYYSKSLPERYSHPKANVFRRLVAEYPSLSTRFTIDYQLKQEAITASLQSFQYLRSHFGIDLLSSSGSASLSSGDDNTVDVIDSGNILFVNDDMLNFLSWSIDRLGLSVNCDLKKINRSDQICSILYDFL